MVLVVVGGGQWESSSEFSRPFQSASSPALQFTPRFAEGFPRFAHKKIDDDAISTLKAAGFKHPRECFFFFLF